MYPRRTKKKKVFSDAYDIDLIKPILDEKILHNIKYVNGRLERSNLLLVLYREIKKTNLENNSNSMTCIACIRWFTLFSSSIRLIRLLRNCRSLRTTSKENGRWEKLNCWLALLLWLLSLLLSFWYVENPLLLLIKPDIDR